MTQSNSNLVQQWSTPSQLVGSGFDCRSSDNGLLTIMYGSLERASHFGWLNAGRTLIDKTYISILWQATQLPNLGVSPHDIATELELFVRAQLQPIWSDMASASETKRSSLAINLVELAATKLFGSSYQQQPASWLLYYLCPQLPIFPTIKPLINRAVPEPGQQDGVFQDSFGEYYLGCQQLFKQMQIQTPLPLACYGNAKEQAIINQLLNNSDWWSRHRFIHQQLDGFG